MNDFDAMQMAAFREESRDLAQELETTMLALERTPDDTELVHRAFRAMHTLKGSSAMCGLTDVAGLTHHAEGLLDKVRAGRLGVTRNLVDLVLSVTDQAMCMVESSTGDKAVDASITDMLVQWIADFDGAAPGEAPGEVPREAPVPESLPSPAPPVVVQEAGPLRCLRLRIVPDPVIWQRGTRLTLVLAELRALGKAVVRVDARRVPPLDEIDPTMCFLSWEVVLLTRVAEATVKDVFSFIEDTCFVHFEDYDPQVELDLMCSEAQPPPGSQARRPAPAARAPARAPATSAAPTRASRGAARPPAAAGTGARQRPAATRPAAPPVPLDDQFSELVAVQARIRTLARKHAATAAELGPLIAEMEQRTTVLRNSVVGLERLPPLPDYAQSERPGKLSA